MERYRELSLPFGGNKIRQDASGQGVSLAAQLLYDAANEEFGNKALRVLELGCGCGIVSIMCALARPEWELTGIDIQQHLVALAGANAQACELNISFEQQDIKTHQGMYDLILSNPPWRELGSGLLSANQSRNISRFEVCCSLVDVIRAVKRCLAPLGQAILIYPSSRAQALQQALDDSSLDIIKQNTYLGKKPYITTLIKHRNIL